MKHAYEHPRDTQILASKFETLSKKGQDFQFEETAFIELIDYFELEESFEKALEVNNFALTYYKFSPKLHTRKARLLIENNQEELGLESLDRAEIFGQSFVETDILRARANCYLKDFNAAFDLLDDLKLNYFTSREEGSLISLEEALIHEKLEDFEKMFFALRNAIELDPFNQQALERMWFAVELSKKHRESVEIHNKVIDANPYAYQAWFNLGNAYYFLCEYKNAIDAFEYAFIINEKFEPAYKEFAEVCFHLKRYNKAIDALEEALPFFQSDCDLLLKIGQAYEYQKNFAKAKVYLYRARDLDSKNDEVLYHLGACYSKEGEYSSAIYFYNKAIKIDDLREDYMIGLAVAYSQTGNYQKALPLFKQATEIGPEISSYWVQYAQFLVNIDGLEEAMDAIDEAEENAYCADILYCKAALLFKSGDRSSALKYLGEALMESYYDRDTFFSFVPELREDKDIKAIMRYYNQAEV
jgi:tetratricopeptide (TPR) repeat protein